MEPTASIRLCPPCRRRRSNGGVQTPLTRTRTRRHAESDPSLEYATPVPRDGSSRHTDLIVLGTLGKLYAHGHGLSGYCRPCRCYFRVPMPVLVAARGADSPMIGMRPLRCAAFFGRATEIRVTAPSKGSG
jgi:hypothetical protein